MTLSLSFLHEYCNSVTPKDEEKQTWFLSIFSLPPGSLKYEKSFNPKREGEGKCSRTTIKTGGEKRVFSPFSDSCSISHESLERLSHRAPVRKSILHLSFFDLSPNFFPSHPSTRRHSTLLFIYYFLFLNPFQDKKGR